MIDLEALKKKWTKLQDSLSPYAGQVSAEVLALIDELAEERRRLEARTTKAVAAADAMWATNMGRDAALANARASALEEAARLVDWNVEQYGDSEYHGSEFAIRLRKIALSTTPASGRFVANEVLEQARTAIEHLAFGLDPDDFPTAQARYAAQLKISEDALKALFPDWTAPRLDIALAALNAERQR